VTTKRTLRRRDRREPLTAEILELFRRGRELVAQGYDDVWADHPDDSPHWEFVRIDKRLCALLQRPPHMVSIFEDLSGPVPDYMRQRDMPNDPDFNGWESGRELQQRLQLRSMRGIGRPRKRPARTRAPKVS
jgi:hypothetical protein